MLSAPPYGSVAAGGRPGAPGIATRILFKCQNPATLGVRATLYARLALVEQVNGGMSLHLVKLCVGCESIADLASWQAERLKQRRRAGEKKPQLFHRTFQMPKRREELLAGGSLYWVIKGLIQVRQPLADIAEGTREDGTPCCVLLLQNELVAVRPVPRRPFQGWRYLTADEAPGDLGRGALAGIGAMPPRLRKQLAELGLI